MLVATSGLLFVCRFSVGGANNMFRPLVAIEAWRCVTSHHGPSRPPSNDYSLTSAKLTMCIAC